MRRFVWMKQIEFEDQIIKLDNELVKSMCNETAMSIIRYKADFLSNDLMIAFKKTWEECSFLAYNDTWMDGAAESSAEYIPT